MFNITLKTDWNHQSGKDVSLLPEVGPVSVDIPISYDSACRFDYARAIEDAEAQLYQAWRFRLDLRSASTAEGGFEDSLKQMLVESLIRQEPDVLGDFSLDSSGLDGEGDGLSLPLKMGGSDYRFSVGCTPDPEGKPDGKAIVEALAQAYREVFQLPGSEMVFSAGQQAELEQKAANWAQGLMAEAGLALPKVEVNLETHAWVGNSLRLCVDVYNDAKVQYELLMPVSNKGELDYSGIEQVAAQIATDWCQRQGTSNSEWMSSRIAEQIGPDAKEYAAWIIEVENNIRAEFWEGVNREMAGHLKKAEELHAKAKKWRQDYDKWIASNGNISISVEGSAGGGVGAEGEITINLTKLPEEQKNTFELIWEGLSKLPGAVYRGVKPHAGEMLRGVEFGFKAAGVVVRESAKIVIEDVMDILVDTWRDKLIGAILGFSAKRIIGGRAAVYLDGGIQLGLFLYGRLQIPERVVEKLRKVESLGASIGEEIQAIKEKVVIPHRLKKYTGKELYFETNRQPRQPYLD